MTAPVLIARPQQGLSRIFPAVAADFYGQLSDLEAEATPDRQAACFLLTLAQVNLTRAQMLFSRNLSPREQLARLLTQHRLGFEAELAAQWQRADFYWRQVQNQLKISIEQDTLWRELAADIAQNYSEVEVLKDPMSLRQRLVDELFIDTHCGFFNGLNQLYASERFGDNDSHQSAGCDRSFAHITFLETLLPYSSLESDAWLTLLASPWQRQVDRYRADKDWHQAIRMCRHRLSLYPKSVPYQTELAEVQAAKILADLRQADSSEQSLANAHHLAKGIQQFERLAQTYPHNPAIYDYLGNLHHLHAIQLGNGMKVAEGLVAVEKALIYAPHLQEALNTRNHLLQSMNQIQARVTQLLAELRRRPNAYLNPQGQHLRNQAKKGLTLQQAYQRSRQATVAQNAVELAQAMQLWHNLSGLPPDPTAQQALALCQSLTQILQQPPPDKASLPDEWQRVGQTKSELSDLPLEPICAFLEQRLWKKQGSTFTPIVTPPPPPPDPPIVLPSQRQPQPSHEPILPWIFSRQHPILKAQVALAMLALFAAGGLGLYEFSVRSMRARAYEKILAAAQQNQSIEILDGAETFLSYSPLSGKDAREDQVKDLYSKTFVAWFMQQPDSSENSTVKRYARRYQQLMAE